MSNSFFSNDTATPEIYTLSLHDALPISRQWRAGSPWGCRASCCACSMGLRSEEHTSELQSLRHLVCRLLLEKKKMRQISIRHWLIYMTCGAAAWFLNNGRLKKQRLGGEY